MPSGMEVRSASLGKILPAAFDGIRAKRKARPEKEKAQQTNLLRFAVEPAGVEPASKQLHCELSTCLFLH